MLLMFILIGGLFHGLILTIILFLISIFLIKLNWVLSIGLSILISGIINSMVNFRVVKESAVVFMKQVEAPKYWQFIQKYKKNNERRFAISPPLIYKGKEYKIIEFSEGITRDYKKLTGFLILDKGKKVDLSEEVKKEVLGVYLFWRHIYNNPLLGEISLTPPIKHHLKNFLKFQEKFKKIIEERKKEEYKDFKEDFRNILIDLDEEVYKQYPYVKEKAEKELEIYNKLYSMFTKPSKEEYEKVIKLISDISKISQKENKYWQHRLNTWERLRKYYDFKIDELPNPDYKSLGFVIFIDLIKFLFKKQREIISDETIKEIVKETSKIPKKHILRMLNKYFLYHKLGIDAIKKNIELNQSFKQLAKMYDSLINDPPLQKIRN